MNRIRYNCKPALRTGLSAIALLLGMASCNDYLPDASAPIIPSGEEVQVELSFGFADEDDGYTVSGKAADTRSGNTVQNGAFCAALAPAALTRAAGDAPDLKPDALYGLYVLQYDASGNLLKQNSTSGSTIIGTKLSYTLAPADDCQLVVIACGLGNSPSAAISGDLSNIRKLTMPSSIFENIPTSGATQAQMNKMPYILHLEHVKVTSDGKLQSVDGAHDARLLLKRLATKLTVNWNMDYTSLDANYKLKEVKLCQVPADFRLLPASESTEWGTTYPSSVSEFKETYRLTTAADLNAGTKTVWIPANVRGTSAKSTSPYYRTKDNAPTAASYVELVVDNSVKQERLYYRAYLGGNEPTDFNLYENTDYNWTLNVTSANYRSDSRIQLLDQTPVVSTNLVETSNCFMMQPGTNICFNPYKHEAGAGGWNTYLTNGSTLAPDKTIASVKVLWQTKDAGTSGELVMGYVIDDSHHQNLVNVSDIGDKDRALVHVKLPVTNGGNAVIAAYNSSNVVVWSWHVWISDYVPAGLDKDRVIDANSRIAAIEAARSATQGGDVQVYGGVSWTASEGTFYKCVIMDRNLGATKAGIQNNLTDAVRTFGLLYQGMRKDPLFSTADGTAVETKVIFDGYGLPVGIPRNSSEPTVASTVQNPSSFFTKLASASYTGDWGGEGKKTIYDPCPKGWRVPSNNYLPNAGVTTTGFKWVQGDSHASLFAGFGNTDPAYVSEGYKASYATNIVYYDGERNTYRQLSATDVPKSTVVGSGYLYVGESGETPGQHTSKSAYFPAVALREPSTGDYRNRTTNNTVFLQSSTQTNLRVHSYEMQYDPNSYNPQNNLGLLGFIHINTISYGFSVRCIQDNLHKRK